MQTQHIRPDAESRGGAVSNCPGLSCLHRHTRSLLCRWNLRSVVLTNYHNSKPELDTTNIQVKVRVSGLTTCNGFGHPSFTVFNPKGTTQTHSVSYWNRVKPFVPLGPVERNLLIHRQLYFDCLDWALGEVRQAACFHRHVKPDVLLN